MLALMQAAREPTFPAEIALVVSNQPEAQGLTHAQSAGIATAVVDHRAYGKDREAFERAMQSVLAQHGIDIVCLAGFMRVLTPWFVQQWPHRILNVHPALLPSFKGLDTHVRALAEGVKLHGATVHLVVPELDSGPIIVQGAVPVLDGDTPESLAARVLGIEHRIYPWALRLLAEDRVVVERGVCRIAGSEKDVGTLIVPQPSDRV